MKTAILSTGSELVQGAITDTNAAWMARHLYHHGITVDQITVIGDSQRQLSEILKELWQSFELVICTGGLGPTTDDITATAVATALNVSLERQPEAERQVRARFANRNFQMADINLKQAELPKGSHILENPVGTAPGFEIKYNGCRSFFLPGVPSEMKAMFRQHIAPLVSAQNKAIYIARCHTFGIGESVLQERLMSLETAYPSVTFSYRAAYPSLTTTISSRRKAEVDRVHQLIQNSLAEWLYSTSDPSLAAAVGDCLRTQHLTISTAESCTGGMIGHELTNIPGASQWLQGSVVAYDNRVKIKVLGVPGDVLDVHGAVSEEVVRYMVKGIQSLMNTNIAVATSGVAGPGGGTEEKPVGTVHIAVASGDVIFHKKCLFKGYSRTKVKTATTWTALQMVYRHLLEKK